METFWIHDFSVLYTDGKYVNLIPDTTQPLNNILNALTRLGLILLLITLLAGVNSTVVVIVLLFLILLIGVYYSQHWFASDLTLQNTADKYFSSYFDSAGKLVTTELDIGDSNTELNVDNSKNKAQHVLTPKELYQYEQSQCRQPTPDNPYMNATLETYAELNKSVPCQDADPRRAFMSKLFVDQPDLYARESLPRNFYTLPYPPNTLKLAQALYDGGDICKNDQTKCTRSYTLDDPRWDRP